MVDRQRAAIIARRSAAGIPRTQPDGTGTGVSTTPDQQPSVRISARISTRSRDALRQLGAANLLSVAALIDLLGAAAADNDQDLCRLVADRADDHRRQWGGAR